MMWPDLAVLSEPDIDGHQSLLAAVEPLSIQNFISQ